MWITRVERLEAATRGPSGFGVFAFDVEVTVDGPVDRTHGMVVNLTDMKTTLRRDVVSALSGRLLDGTNGTGEYRTPEELARGIWDALGGVLAGRPVVRVRLRGHPTPIVEAYGGEYMDVTRSYEFSAAHRLHSDGLSDAQNLAVFGKCNNPRGHGHNYVLAVTLRGAIDANGELLDAGTFDRVVVESVVDRWDHKNLNEDLDEFRGVNPTAEEIARVAWDRIRAQLARVTGGGGRVALHRVKLRETARNHVEYYGGES
jgi:6-pyruvoyltetrahydropterin/6-carboxytetrahydropterin synthase